jgi:hypothetical protein
MDQLPMLNQSCYAWEKCSNFEDSYNLQGLTMNNNNNNNNSSSKGKTKLDRAEVARDPNLEIWND